MLIQQSKSNKINCSTLILNQSAYKEHKQKYKQNNVKKIVQLCILIYSTSLCSTQIPEVLFYEKPLYTFGGITPHINMPLSVEYTVTSAAWSYPRVNNIAKYVGNDKKEIYLGYFNYKLCYNYNSTNKYFYPNGGLTDTTYECTIGQSGNFLNWASLTTLDLIRYSLTGGGRDIDEPDLTVLKRANIPNIINYSNLFPLKQYKNTYIKSCRNKMYFDSRKSDLDSDDCAVLDNKASQQYEVRVQVCNELDANLRSDVCKKYPRGNYKPVGVLQRNNNSNRFSLLSYLNLNSGITDIFSRNLMSPQSGSWDNDLYTYMWGGALRAPAKFLGRYRYDTNLDFIPNVQREWNEYDGTLVLDANHERVNTKIQPKSVDNISLSDKTGQTVKGNEKTENGVSILNYINQFGLDGEYRVQDPLSELLGESLRYLGNYNAPTNLPAILLDQSTTRDAFHIYKRILNELSGNDKKNALYSHLDKFPVITDWNWKNNGVDEPMRGTCEKNNANLITFADTNSWRDIYKDLPSWKATAIDDNAFNPFFNGKSLMQLLDSINPKLQHMASLLPLSLSYSNSNGDKVNPYIISALVKGAYQDGIKYQNADFSDTPVVQKVRSVVLDVGENSGMFSSDDCHLYTSGIYGTHTQAEIDKLLLRSNCSTFADARENLTTSNSNGSINSNAISSFNSLLPSKGYFFPLDSNNIIDNIQQGFKIPSEASGNISAGIVQNLGFVNGVQQIYLFRNNLVSTPNNVDTSISTEMKKYKLSVNSNGDVITSEDTQTKAWESTLKSSLRKYNEINGGRNIILGGAPKLELNNENRTAPLYFTYTAIKAAETQPLQESDAFNALSIGLPQKDTNNEGLEEMIKKRISYIRGNSENEQTDDSKNMFRKRNFMLGSTANSTPIYAAGINIEGRNMLYLAGNDGMMHGIDADNGSEMFAFIPRNILSSLYEHGEQGYIDKPLIEGAPAVKTIVPTSANPSEKTILVSGMGAGARGLFALDVTLLSTSQSNITKSNVLFEFTEKDDKYIGNIIGQPEFVSLKTGTTTTIAGKTVDVIETFVAVSSGYNNINDSTVFDTNGQAINQTYLYLLKTNKSYAAKWVEGSNYYRIKIADGIVNNGLSAPAALSNNSLTQYIYVGDLQGSLWRLDFKGVLNTVKPTSKEVFTTKNNATLMPITAKPVITYAPTGGLMVIFGTGRYFGLNDLGSMQKNQQALVSFNDVDFSSNQLQTYNLLNLNARQISNGASVAVSSDSANARGWYINLPNSLNQGERMITPVKVLDGVVLFTTQNLGQFTNKLCGDTKGSTASVRLENGLDGSYSSKSKFIGNLLSLQIVLPPDAFDSHNTIGVAGNYVRRSEYNSEINFTVGSATNKSETATYYFEKATGKYKSGVVSWREIIDLKSPI